MWDFLTFRKMLTPIVIQILFWLGVVACILGGIGAILVGIAHIDSRRAGTGTHRHRHPGHRVRSARHAHLL